MWRPAMFAAWVIQPMTTMIRKCRVLIAASILTAVIMSFPRTTSSEAAVATNLPRATTAEAMMIQRDQVRVVSSKICPIDWRQSARHVKRLIRCAAEHHGVSPDMALYVAWRESRYRPSAYNAAGEAAGIYQHLLKYWPERAADFGFKDWSVFNARANIMVTMRMVRQYGWDPWAL